MSKFLLVVKRSTTIFLKKKKFGGFSYTSQGENKESLDGVVLCCNNSTKFWVRDNLILALETNVAAAYVDSTHTRVYIRPSLELSSSGWSSYIATAAAAAVGRKEGSKGKRGPAGLRHSVNSRSRHWTQLKMRREGKTRRRRRISFPLNLDPDSLGSTLSLNLASATDRRQCKWRPGWRRWRPTPPSWETKNRRQCTHTHTDQVWIQ